MSGWVLAQIILNIAFIAAALVCWARLNRPQKDDPRLSRGLQLLQSKIAILEDLSDRTDMQVKQLTHLLEQKGREVQECIAQAQSQIHKVESAIQKSLDVSEIIQEKIPHKEIVERQNTVKYVQAAKLAHQGLTADEIAEKIDIPKSELEFIVKVNRNKLMFSEQHLPTWAKEKTAGLEIFESEPINEEVKEESSVRPRDYSAVFETPKVSEAAQEDDKRIQEEFKKAIEDAKAKEIEKENSLTNTVANAVAETSTELMTEGLEVAKKKIAGLADKILSPYFLDKVEDHKEEAIVREEEEKERIELEQAAKEREEKIEKFISQKIIKSEAEEARAIKPFVFKNLNKEL